MSLPACHIVYFIFVTIVDSKKCASFRDGGFSRVIALLGGLGAHERGIHVASSQHSEGDISALGRKSEIGLAQPEGKCRSC
jgi:hypothetical protein